MTSDLSFIIRFPIAEFDDFREKRSRNALLQEQFSLRRWSWFRGWIVSLHGNISTTAFYTRRVQRFLLYDHCLLVQLQVSVALIHSLYCTEINRPLLTLQIQLFAKEVLLQTNSTCDEKASSLRGNKYGERSNEEGRERLRRYQAALEILSDCYS